MSLGMKLGLSQRQAITPQLQQALRLLQLSSLEFGEEIQQMLASNPFLEESTLPGGESRSSDTDSAAEEITASRDRDEPGDGDSERLLPQTGGNGEGDWTDWSAAPLSLREQLSGQLRLFPFSDRDRALIHLIIDELTDAGYLETSLEELSALVPPECEVEVSELEAALKQVQQLEPVGIGARSLQECLLLQLQALPDATCGRTVAMQLVGEYFELLARRDFVQLQHCIGCDATALHTARALIRRLDPKPGRQLGADDTRYVVPDVLVRKSRGQWTCCINPAIQPRLRINRACAEIAVIRGSCTASFSAQLQEARWFLRNIEQRFTTILRVSESIVRRQRAFLDYGEAAMKPLMLKDIADEVGVHESTVCRVTNGKYMATARGIFEFKYLFSRELSMDDGGACSALAIRALMKELITAEDPSAPLSDAQLARLLAGQGMRLARRTVTKYRTQMRLPSVELRRVGSGIGP